MVESTNSRRTITKKSTKEKILEAALELFSQYGYEAVRIEDIANKVGIKGPSIYKHYSGKQAIFDAIVDGSDCGYEKNMKVLQLNFEKGDAIIDNYLTLSPEERNKRIVKMFCHVIHDKETRNFRRLMLMESYNHPEFNNLSNLRYFYDLVNRFELLFTKGMEQKIIRQEDARALAILFISPITALVEICEKEPKREKECIESLERHMELFRRAYVIG